MNYKAIIVGGNHHNGLGLARSLGGNGIEVHSIVADECKKSFLAHSKFVSSCTVFSSEKEAFDYVLAAYGNEPERPMLIPYSDRAACELDLRLDEFKERFHVPSIGNQQGAIAAMMDKQKQVAFAQKHNLRMAKTCTVLFADNDQPADLPDVPYPCIIKPAVSAEGDKKDIAVCQTEQELSTQLEKYRKAGYSSALVQEYLTIDYEIDVFGCIINADPGICFVPTQTIRSWPPQGGTNSFSKIITEESLVKKCRKIIQGLKEEGFYGLYDIELFVVGDDILLNEINYRNSGDVYMALNQGYHYAYAWACDCLGLPVSIMGNPLCADYTMTECADLRNAVFGSLSLKQWLSDLRKCSDFALKYPGDMKPAPNRYAYYIGKILGINK